MRRTEGKEPRGHPALSFGWIEGPHSDVQERSTRVLECSMQSWEKVHSGAHMNTETALHTAVCQAVALLNAAPEVARLTEGRQVRDILRQALVDYAGAYMDEPTTEKEREAIAKKHRKS